MCSFVYVCDCGCACACVCALDIEPHLKETVADVSIIKKEEVGVLGSSGTEACARLACI